MAPDPLVRLQAVSKVFPGGIVGLDAVDLDIISGEFITLLGPSGCGKTTSLRVIAGFESPSSGKVLLDGRDITALRPFDRPVNTVFQDYALFPHMNVAENVGFGLSLRKPSGSEQAKRVGKPSTWSVSPTSFAPVFRNSQAASASVSHLLAPSSASRACCSSTSRCRRSTRICASRCRSS